MDGEAFGTRKEEWLPGTPGLPDGTPPHETIGRVFSNLDARQFESCFTEWVPAVREATQSDGVAVDRKAA